MNPIDLAQHMARSIQGALLNESKVSPAILGIQGFSGNKTRHLYNNLCSLPNATYLEIGTYTGSTLISALYKNPGCKGVCVDNWSEFNGPRDEFILNATQFLTNGETFRLIDKDCWQVTPEDIPERATIFLYDGWHSYETQKKAITYYYKFWDKYSIVLIDDWTCDWVDVKRGTMDGFAESPLRILAQQEIGLINTTQHHFGGDTFWNGCGIFLVERLDI